MTIYTAHCLLVQERQDWSRPKLPYLPLSFYGRVLRSISSRKG
ncbi:MAG: hypothetical protein AAF826_10885 [Pseudomonadota bacterium]